MTDVQRGPSILLVHGHDVASIRMDLSECVVRICLLDLAGDEKDALNARLPWRLRDQRARGPF